MIKIIKPSLKYILGWFDNQIVENKYLNIDLHGKEIDWARVIPYIIIHLSIISIFFVDFSLTAFWIFIGMYAIRMFAITGFYHRYFSHKTFKTSRLTQFIFAIIGASAVQRGPIWWAAHHREHHMHSDTIHDKHSPKAHSFFWSHTGWFLTKANFITHTRLVKELSRFPELRLIDRFDIIIPILTCLGLFYLGEYLNLSHPDLKTNGLQLLSWGFVLSTILLYHSTFLVNSVAHLWGKKRYNTKDSSRNNFIVAILTFGEGWHNNHHHFPGSANQGFYWWEIDITYYLLMLLRTFGIIWDIRTVSEKIRESNKIKF
ncbi:MAG: acyl-CoA desaturase [Nitrosomonadales bacterium]|nr:acyl-CoA desaturase [Nitrosomonadales bacterium]|tara:strand:- start:130 stop:1077 length:948 start_codon:yes stop_codon:yes gene_type:complete